MLKKILSLIIIIVFSLNIISFADDKIEEESKEEVNEIIQTVSNITDLPKINSRSAVVIDRNTKSILYGKNESIRRPMASTTKIMTAMVVIENTNLDNFVEVSKKAASIGGSRLGLKSGDKISVKDLLYGLLLRSGNDAAVALAEYVGGSIDGFSTLMNNKAEELHLTNTHFITPHGLDSDGHYTTAYELALITDYALNNNIFAQIVNTKSYTININGHPKVINNTHELLGNLSGVYGVKTGFTNGAGRCLVTSVRRNNLDIICVVLGADTKKARTTDSVKLIEYTYKNYNLINLDEKIEKEFKSWNEINKNRISIEKGLSNHLDLSLKKESSIICPIQNGTEDDINININANLNLKAPIQENTVIGELSIVYRNKTIANIPIFNTNKVNKKGIKDYILDFINNYNSYLKSIINLEYSKN